MQTSVKSIRKRRKFSVEFKRDMVREFERGKFSVYQLSRLFGVNSVQIYRWIYTYSTFNQKGYRVVENKDSSTQKLKELEQKVRELQQKLGEKQIQIEFLEEMMLVAKEQLNIDIKKNYSTRQSNGSGKKGSK